jgi:hypothetical protein
MKFRLGALLVVSTAIASAQDPSLEIFEKKIRPVLAKSCYPCHSSATAAAQGGLRLDAASGIRKGGNSGALLEAGNPERSLLIRAIRYTDKNLKMPPGKALPPEVVQDFEDWVRAGAGVPETPVQQASGKASLWSLKKPQLAPLPQVRGAARNDIDRFILAALEAKDLTLSPEADKRTLIRRATFDLTGLPPTVEEIEQFAKDKSPDAYERLIDRLLASPRYGERWGRHWLDVARYADSVNDSVNAGQRYPWSYTYRDWVIRALNEDLPYDRFLLYQLAADLVPDADPKHKAALGFLSLGREFPKSFPETVDDRIDAVTRGFMGFTVACARCHDHKYDPIPTKDYYSMYAVFSNVRAPEVMPLLEPNAKISEQERLYQQRIDRISEALQDYRKRRNAEMIAFFKTQVADYLLAAHDAESLSNPEIEELVRDRQLNLHVLARWRKFLQQSKQADGPVLRLWHKAAAIKPDQFAREWASIQSEAKSNKYLEAEVSSKQVASLKDLAQAYAAVLAKHDRAEPFTDADAEAFRQVAAGPSSPSNIPLNEFELVYTEGDSNNTRSIKVRRNAMVAQAAYDGAAPRAMAMEDLPEPTPAHVFIRGNPNNPGAPTPPRFLSCLDSEEQVFTKGSGRLELAQKIIDPANPLTARVLVNRVWMHHFGFGLVRTPSDFGFRGDRPTHPELLDYLALKFIESGWSMKKLHKLIMTSAAYRQASADNEAGRKVDPDNLLLWRMNRRRLEIESLRDSMLAAAGRLDLSMGGVPFALTAQPSVPRRSVYGFIERGRVPALLSAFDFASPDQHAPMRYVTTVPQQALFFLNSPFVAEQARHIAKNVERAHSNPEARVEAIYRTIFRRSPDKWELEAGVRYITQASESKSRTVESPWSYGIGEYQPSSERVLSFRAFSTFVPERWQGGAALPAANFGKASLGATGGEPGERSNESVIRRWTSPVSGKLNIEGSLRHGQPAVPYGDGVRGRIVSSRHGELASWSVNGGSAETKLSGIAVEPGDTIDFIVEARADGENDAFNWNPTLKVGERTWNAKNDFAGPAPEPLGAWARYAQVLLNTNEFAFVD